MSHATLELLTALRDLRQSITAEAALRIERWQPDIQQTSFATSAKISRIIWRSGIMICATFNES